MDKMQADEYGLIKAKYSQATGVVFHFVSKDAPELVIEYFARHSSLQVHRKIPNKCNPYYW